MKRTPEFEISIIIPVYNMEKYLKQCIESIHIELHEEIQVILINDGSTDSSGIICSSYASRNPKQIRYIEKQIRAGVSTARNDGLDLAEGKYIYFMDADDFLHDDYYYSIKEMLRVTADLYAFNYNLIDHNNQIYSEYKKNKGLSELNSEYCNSIFKKLEYQIWDKIFLKTIIDQYSLRFNSEMRWSEDLDFWIRYAMHIETVYVDEAIVYVHRINQSGAVASVDKEVLKDISEAYLKQIEFLNNKKAELYAYRSLVQEYVEHLGLTIYRCFLKKGDLKSISDEIKRLEICNCLKYKPFSISAKYKMFCIKHDFILGLVLYFKLKILLKH